MTRLSFGHGYLRRTSHSRPRCPGNDVRGEQCLEVVIDQAIATPQLNYSMVVVGRGVDPRTYRFSGGRSAD
jgi:hypothetical protein